MVFKIISYKSEQGRFTRGTAYGLLLALAYYGATTFYIFLSWDWSSKDFGFKIPVFEIPVTVGFLVAVGAFLAMALGLRYAVNHPKLADLLIETEGELKRVTWPSWPETWNGSIVVIITVITMLILLAGADMILSRFFDNIIF